MAPLTIVYVLMLALNNLCLKYVEVTFYQVNKKTTRSCCSGRSEWVAEGGLGGTLSVDQLYYSLYVPDSRQNDVGSGSGCLCYCIFGLRHWIVRRNQLFVGGYLLRCRLIGLCRVVRYLRAKDLARRGQQPMVSAHISYLG